MRFYLITTHTCYCGEESYYYVKVDADGKVMDIGYDTTLEEYADYLAYENAYEWWDDEAELDFDGDFPIYLAEAYSDIEEINEEEYLKNM